MSELGYVVEDEFGNVISKEFDTQEEAIHYMAKLDTTFIKKTRPKVKGVGE